eukprot:1161150-Pelagomonas_calceolata.AAC.4
MASQGLLTAWQANHGKQEVAAGLASQPWQARGCCRPGKPTMASQGLLPAWQARGCCRPGKPTMASQGLLPAWQTNHGKPGVASSMANRPWQARGCCRHGKPTMASQRLLPAWQTSHGCCWHGMPGRLDKQAQTSPYLYRLGDRVCKDQRQAPAAAVAADMVSQVAEFGGENGIPFLSGT